ncbi:hypothetical protein [Superficieibacter sp. 1612_C1]|jgi:hypothetical protein|uniref:hypothetical protein n=1 Tax=unclassified Superficieibacter TaxID=2645744 RepID=UPI001883F004|nr:hypothetical protein [Superficieibacter sp. 1612_C1]MDU2941070.1 hypothetical protein [Enterobacteriaceae bacterium]
MTMEYTCNDCQKCAPFDVFKGTCEHSQQRILLDSPVKSCQAFVRKNQCKFCQSYCVKAGTEFVGQCHEKMVYPTMNACEKFQPLS